jgi:hypothetical protein
MSCQHSIHVQISLPIKTEKNHTPSDERKMGHRTYVRIQSFGRSFSVYLLEVGQAELKAKSVTGERILINSTS